MAPWGPPEGLEKLQDSFLASAAPVHLPITSGGRVGRGFVTPGIVREVSGGRPGAVFWPLGEQLLECHPVDVPRTSVWPTGPANEGLSRGPGD